MRDESALSTAIEDTDRRAQYDACVKRLLAQKVVLAYILKYAVPEFESCALEDIRDRYIEGVEISSRSLEPGMDNAPIGQPMDGSAVAGLNTESNFAGEGKVFYDIIFSVTVPGNGGMIRLIINVEAQMADPSAYELQTRGIYYCARMLSAQKTVVFNHSDYQKLCKVYSIWVCMNPKAGFRNTMTIFETNERPIIGSRLHERQTYDKMAVILLNLGGDRESDASPLLSFLEILLSQELSPAEKKNRLTAQCGILWNSDMDKEMSMMCNLSQGLVEKGYAQGMERGTAKGQNMVMRAMQYLLMKGRGSELERLAYDADFLQAVIADMDKQN